MTDRTVLVTRPAGQGDRLCERLSAEGFLPVHQPLLEIEFKTEPDPLQRQQIMDLDQYQHIIFVSSNAVRCGMEWIEQFWPQLPAGLHWYAVGSASADLLESYGVAVHCPQQMDSEGLLALPPLQDLQGHKLLIVKGDGGRAVLKQRLSERGGRVENLSAYRRRQPQLEPDALGQLFIEKQFAAVLLSSGEGLGNMVSLLGPRAADIVAESILVVPGQRVAELAAESGFQRIAVAENATDEAMMRVVVERCRCE
jgi:uroporphyrinogen-III synthase